MTVARILVVDDDPATADAVAALRSEGFAVMEATAGRAALRAIEEFRPDVVLLGTTLPDLDAFELARRLGARRPRIPVILLSERNATQDKVAGLAVGDDYVTKPFSLTELVARVRALLRRTRGDHPVLRFADLVLDERTHAVHRGAQPVDLTPREFELLRFLMRNPRRVLTKVQILDGVWGDEHEPSVVETYVAYLRKKLDPLGPPLIRTIRLAGYALREPGE